LARRELPSLAHRFERVYLAMFAGQNCACLLLRGNRPMQTRQDQFRAIHFALLEV
jgi:hypothetical protein